MAENKAAEEDSKLPIDRETADDQSEPIKEHDVRPIPVAPIRFSFTELKLATEDFSTEIGDGVSATVYKGVLVDGKVIAVKKMLQKNDFMLEYGMLSKLQHPNVVNMLGYCDEGKYGMIVLEYLSLGSLDSYIHDHSNKSLEWNARNGIALGVVRALKYLHEEQDPPILLGDVWAVTVLLDDQLNAKLSDFAFSIDGREDCWGSNFVYEKRAADMQQFGTMLLELLAGQEMKDQNLDPSDEQYDLVAWAHGRYSLGKGITPDPRLTDYPTRDFHRTFTIALLCTVTDTWLQATAREASDCLFCLQNPENSPPTSPGEETGRRDNTDIENLLEKKLKVAKEKEKEKK